MADFKDRRVDHGRMITNPSAHYIPTKEPLSLCASEMQDEINQQRITKGDPSVDGIELTRFGQYEIIKKQSDYLFGYNGTLGTTGTQGSQGTAYDDLTCCNGLGANYWFLQEESTEQRFTAKPYPYGCVYLWEGKGMTDTSKGVGSLHHDNSTSGYDPPGVLFGAPSFDECDFSTIAHFRLNVLSTDGKGLSRDARSKDLISGVDDISGYGPVICFMDFDVEIYRSEGCEELQCPGTVILYTTTQMSAGESQTLRPFPAVPGVIYEWQVSGAGSISPATGSSVTFTAGTDNENCENNPTVTLLCDGVVVDTLSMTVSTWTGSEATIAIEDYTVENNYTGNQGCASNACYYEGGTHVMLIWKTRYNCFGDILSRTTYGSCVRDCDDGRLGCWVSTFTLCEGSGFPVTNDNRTAQMLEQGCCITGF